MPMDVKEMPTADSWELDTTDGARNVRIMGEDIAVRAQIHTINGFLHMLMPKTY